MTSVLLRTQPELFHRRCSRSLSSPVPTLKRLSTAFPRAKPSTFANAPWPSVFPEDALLVETKATNTRENIEFTRALLLDHGLAPDSVLA